LLCIHFQTCVFNNQQKSSEYVKITEVTIYVCRYRWGMDWWMDLLTTYTHHSELQVITALSLISTLYKSLHAMSSPACSVLISHSLAMASNSGDSSASRAQFLSSQPPMQNSVLN
jgi:hypothetical protein